jgi:hypothetical protein
MLDTSDNTKKCCYYFVEKTSRFKDLWCNAMLQIPANFVWIRTFKTRDPDTNCSNIGHYIPQAAFLAFTKYEQVPKGE